jgi:transcriptional regulator with XRE-family HTH domain
MELVFYDNYIRLCNSVNKSPSAAAIEMGISKPSVNRWKNGSQPTDATIRRIANYFNVTVEDLTKGEHKENTAQEDGVETNFSEQKNKPTPENGSERDYGDSVLMDAFKRADESTQEAILLLLKLK